MAIVNLKRDPADLVADPVLCENCGGEVDNPRRHYIWASVEDKPGLWACEKK